MASREVFAAAMATAHGFARRFRRGDGDSTEGGRCSRRGDGDSAKGRERDAGEVMAMDQSFARRDFPQAMATAP